MSKVVFILGAGASKEAGAPLMCEFLSEASTLLNLGRVGTCKEEFELVFKAIGALQNVHSKSQLDIRNVESVFAAFEMAKLLGKFPGMDKEQIPCLIDAMKLLIVKTLSQSIPFPYSSNHGFSVPKPYGAFADLVDHLRKKSRVTHSVSVITFNYDLALDFSFNYHGVRYNYHLDNNDNEAGIPLLKLHGSTHWAYCEKCKQVVPINFENSLHDFITMRANSFSHIDLAAHFKNYKHCDHSVGQIPVIVPPTWNKSDYHMQIDTVWKRAAQELMDAEYIFVIGYSLPQTDVFFKFLYALGTVGDNPLKGFYLFDPDPTGNVQKRFEEMLGPGAKDVFHCEKLIFSNAIPAIKKLFPSS